MIAVAVSFALFISFGHMQSTGNVLYATCQSLDEERYKVVEVGLGRTCLWVPISLLPMLIPVCPGSTRYLI